jgi:ATP-dependent Zn protease
MARVGILRHHLRDALEAVDLRPVAERLEGATGAEIELLVRGGRRRARRRRGEMTLNDVEAGLPREAVLSPELVWRACVHESGHLVVGTRLCAVSGWRPEGACVSRRGNDLGETMFVSDPGIDATKETLLAGIVVLLAGAAAEDVLIGSRGAGSGGADTSDLVRATDMAASIEASFGLGSTLSAVHGGLRAVRQTVTSSVRLSEAVERILTECMERARALVASERQVVAATARALESDGKVDAPVVPPKDSLGTPGRRGGALPRAAEWVGGDGKGATTARRPDVARKDSR